LPVAEHFADQFGRAVGHQVLLGEVLGRVHQAHQLDDAHDAVQVAAAGVLQGADQVDRDRTRGGLAVFEFQVAAELALPGRTVRFLAIWPEMKTRLPVWTDMT
jgi:hypothetical protein